MAVGATIIKVSLDVADMDRHHYGSYSLTLAQHPSETAERVMVRLLAFALNASDTLAFTKGLSADEEPDLWQRSLTGDIELWIELGQASEKRIRKACGRSSHVLVYSYGRHHVVDPWWKQLQSQLTRFDNLSVFHIPSETCKQIEVLYSRNLAMQVNVQDGEATLHVSGESVTIIPRMLSIT